MSNSSNSLFAKVMQNTTLSPEASSEFSTQDSSQTTAELEQTELSPRRQKAILAGSELIASTGEDVKREGLERTPLRFAKAMADLTQGYDLELDEVVGSGLFQAESQGLVLMKDVEFYSLCEHHLLPFWGKATIAYYPDNKILGLSKMPRIVEMFARRFQLQERLNRQIGEAIQEIIQPRAIRVQVEAAHMCVMMRGVQKQHTSTLTQESWGMENLHEYEREEIRGVSQA